MKPARDHAVPAPPLETDAVHPEGARIAVRLAALAANYRELARRASAAAIAPVVKADAYGLGMASVARHLAALGADTFFVARLEEGIALRQALPRIRIFVLDGLTPGAAPFFIAHRLTPVLNALEEISEWSAAAHDYRVPLDAVLHIDTGMNRSGLGKAQTAELARASRTLLAGLNPVLIMSHLACADEPDHALNRIQRERFRVALAMLPPAPASLAATAGIELGADYLFDTVRPGLGLYGGNPVLSRPNPYRAVATVTAPVLQIRQLAAGDTVGYGAAFTAQGPCTVATVAAGYADGLRRAMGGRAEAIVGGTRVPFAGRISMDLATLDVSRVPPEALACGAEVEFLGDRISLEDLALAAGTINHEILTSLSPRAKRVYVES